MRSVCCSRQFRGYSGEIVVQSGRNRNLIGPTQRNSGLLLGFHLRRAFWTDGNMLRGTQIWVHPEFAIHVGGHGLARQMFGWLETRLTTT